jgi:hypothetical protein
MKYIVPLAVFGFLVNLLASAPAQAQTVLDPAHKLEGATTRESLNTRLETVAGLQQKRGVNAARAAVWTVAWPSGPDELSALGKFAILLVTTVSQTATELPLRSVYVRAGGRDIPLQKLHSWQSQVDSHLNAYSVLGHYREDGFYFLPAGAVMRNGEVLMDFAVNRVGYRVIQLPQELSPPQFFKTYPGIDPAPGAVPDKKTLKTFLEREFPGLPLPRSLL